MSFYLSDAGGTYELTVDPEYDYSDSGEKVQNSHRTRDGSLYTYTWGSYDTISFSVEYVDQAFKDSVNAWWDNDYVVLKHEVGIWDISISTYSSVSPLFSHGAFAYYGIDFKQDNGSSFYLGDSTNGIIYQHDMSTNWDISTASYSSLYFTFGSELASNALGDFKFRKDGMKLYLLHNNTGAGNSAILEYSLSSPWLLSSITYIGKTNIHSTLVVSGQGGLDFDDDGKVFIVGSGLSIAQFNLSTAWDISTLTHSGTTISITGSEVFIGGMVIRGSRKMYVGGDSTDSAYQYTLGDSWTLLDSSYDGKSRDLDPADFSSFYTRGFASSSDNSKLFVLDAYRKRILEYTLFDTTVEEFVLTNKSKPIDKVNAPYTTLYKGSIELSTF